MFHSYARNKKKTRDRDIVAILNSTNDTNMHKATKNAK